MVKKNSKEFLWELCKNFIEDNEISCSETIYQTDRVVEKSLEFIESICDIVGYRQFTEDD